MKKLIILGITTLASTLACADQALQVQYGQPVALGTTPNYVSTNIVSDHIANAFTLHAGYSGWKVDSNDLGKGRFRGFQIGSTYDFDRRGLWTKYENQSSDNVDVDLISFGGQYTFYNRNNTYVLAQAGIGYMWGDLKQTETFYDDVSGDDISVTAKISADNFLIPVNVEIGHYFTPHLAAYAGLGYKWTDNHKAKGCLNVENEGFCDSGRSGIFDVHGTSYNFGLKYRF